MRVRFTRSVSARRNGRVAAYSKGREYDLDEAQANAHISSGHAVSVEPAESPRRAPSARRRSAGPTEDKENVQTKDDEAE